MSTIVKAMHEAWAFAYFLYLAEALINGEFFVIHSLAKSRWNLALALNYDLHFYPLLRLLSFTAAEAQKKHQLQQSLKELGSDFFFAHSFHKR